MAQRDYQVEYARRIARGLAKRLSRSQARGHPRAGESSIRARPAKFDLRLEAGLKALRQGKSLTATARAQKVSPERFRNYVKGLPFVEKRHGRFVVGTDPRRRRVRFYSNGRPVTTIVQGYQPALLAGTYWDAVGEFLGTNDPDYLAPFIGAQITDVRGRTYTLETRPNVLYRLAREGGETFEQVYRIVV
jgi:hypothetical protein